MIEMADAKRIMFEQPQENWRSPQGRPRTTWLHKVNDDLFPFDMELSEAREAAQNWPLWRMLAKHSAVILDIGHKSRCCTHQFITGW